MTKVDIPSAADRSFTSAGPGNPTPAFTRTLLDVSVRERQRDDPAMTLVGDGNQVLSCGVFMA